MKTNYIFFYLNKEDDLVAISTIVIVSLVASAWLLLGTLSGSLSSDSAIHES